MMEKRREGPSSCVSPSDLPSQVKSLHEGREKWGEPVGSPVCGPSPQLVAEALSRPPEEGSSSCGNEETKGRVVEV